MFQGGSINAHKTDVRLDGSVLRELRLARGWSQGQLAAKAKVDQSVISRLERGRRGGNARISTVCNLAEALKSDLASLLYKPEYAGHQVRKKRSRHVGALPIELHIRVTYVAGLEPTTTRLTIEVTLNYTSPEAAEKVSEEETTKVRVKSAN